MDKFPHINAELLEAIKRLFPQRLPTVTMTDREIWIEVGKGQVIEFLEARHREQREKALSNFPTETP